MNHGKIFDFFNLFQHLEVHKKDKENTDKQKSINNIFLFNNYTSTVPLL
jgi:hypothetical protein